MYKVQSDHEVERDEREERGIEVDYIGTTLSYSPTELNCSS